jgi:signal-transduction protein with cAMP-binding, CBS, and nucleotidyltransferase domain
MKTQHEKDVKDKIKFLKRTVPFEDWSEGAIKQIAHESKWVTYRIGDEICTQGQPVDDILFIKKGICDVYADYELDGVCGKVKVGQYKVQGLH